MPDAVTYPWSDLELILTRRGVTNVAGLLNVSTTGLRRVQDAGVLTEAQADRWAGKLGMHPCEIWPAWWDVPMQETLFDEAGL